MKTFWVKQTKQANINKLTPPLYIHFSSKKIYDIYSDILLKHFESILKFIHSDKMSLPSCQENSTCSNLGVSGISQYFIFSCFCLVIMPLKRRCRKIHIQDIISVQCISSVMSFI